MTAVARIRRLAIAASVLVLSGCVSTTFHPAPGFVQRDGPPVSPEFVLLLSSAPSRPFVALGEIEAWVSGFPSNDTAVRKTREAAAAVGADAVIKRASNLFAEEQGSEGQSVSPGTLSFTVTAIRYTGPLQASP